VLNLLSKKGYAFYTILIWISSVILSCSQVAMANAPIHDPSGPWQKQKALKVNGQALTIPTYLPYGWMAPKLYWTATPYSNPSNGFAIYFGSKKNCNGEHECGFAEFRSYKLTEPVEGEFISLFDDLLKEIKITSSITGHYKRGKCYAYCNPSELYWIVNRRLYSVGGVISHDEKTDILELKKSALTFIQCRAREER
jgi:hypothetical protein